MWSYRLIDGLFEREWACPQAVYPTEQLVEVTHWSLCGSDLRGLRQQRLNPYVGHEFAGVIVSGDEKISKSVVSIFPIVPCFSCPSCSALDYRNCPTRKTYGFELAGATAKLLAVDSRLLFQHKPQTAAAKAVLTEHLACCIHLMHSAIREGVSAGSRICVIGDGPMAFGIATVFAKQLSCSPFVVARHESRSEIARDLGFNSNVIGHRHSTQAVNECDVLVLSCPLEEKDFASFKWRNAPFVAPVARQPEGTQRTLLRAGVKFIDSYAYTISDFSEAVEYIDNYPDFIAYNPKVLNMSSIRSEVDLLSLPKSAVKYIFTLD